MAAFLVIAAVLAAVFVGRTDFLFDDVSAVYVSMLFRSVGFSVLQAAVTVILATALALPMAFATTVVPRKWRGLITEWFRVVGVALFFAPTLVAALTYLMWTQWFESLPKFGWIPIVLVHVSINVFFLAHVFSVLMNDELRQGLRMVEVSRVFGVSRTKMYFRLWFRPLLREWFRWLPLIFWWSFSAFTTVLILGGGPRYSSPEVLLFYLLGAGDRPARLLVLVTLQVFVGGLALRFTRTKQKKLGSQELRQEISSIERDFQRGPGEKLIGIAGGATALLFAIFWLPSIWQAITSLNFDAAVAESALRSWSILWRAIVSGSVLLCIGFCVGNRISKWFAFTLVISPMVLIGTLFHGNWFSEASDSFRLWATAVLSLWSTIPVLVLWIFSRHDQFVLQHRDLLKTFRPACVFRVRYLYLPVLGLPILSYFQILVLSVLGDVGIVSTVLGSSNGLTLSQGIYAKVASYQFDSAFSMFGYLMLSMLPVWVLLVLLRRKNEIRTI